MLQCFTLRVFLYFSITLQHMLAWFCCCCFSARLFSLFKIIFDLFVRLLELRLIFSHRMSQSWIPQLWCQAVHLWVWTSAHSCTWSLSLRSYMKHNWCKDEWDQLHSSLFQWLCSVRCLWSDTGSSSVQQTHPSWCQSFSKLTWRSKNSEQLKCLVPLPPSFLLPGNQTQHSTLRDVSVPITHLKMFRF